MPANKQNNKKHNGQQRKGPKKLPLYTTTGVPAYREVLAYRETATLVEPAAFAGKVYTYRLNSLYDPNFTGAGSTYYGYATKANLYGAYRVLSTRVRVTFSGSTGGLTYVGLMFGGNSTFSADPNSWAVQPNSMAKQVLGNSGTTHSIARFDVTKSLPDVLGVSQREFQLDMDFRSDFGTSPLKPAYVTLWMKGDSSSAQTVSYEILMSSMVEFSKPLQSIV